MDEEHGHFGIVVGIETAGGLAELGEGPSGSAGNKWKAEVVIINYWIMNDMGIYTFLTSFLFNYSLFWLSLVVALHICIHFFVDSDIEVWKVYMDFIIHEQKAII